METRKKTKAEKSSWWIVGYYHGPGHQGQDFEWFYGDKKDVREAADSWIADRDYPVLIQFEQVKKLPGWKVRELAYGYLREMEHCEDMLRFIGVIRNHAKEKTTIVSESGDGLHCRRVTQPTRMFTPHILANIYGMLPQRPYGRREHCERCRGRGSVEIKRKESLGRGKKRKTGWRPKYRLCPACQGEGFIYASGPKPLINKIPFDHKRFKPILGISDLPKDEHGSHIIPKGMVVLQGARNLLAHLQQDHERSLVGDTSFDEKRLRAIRVFGKSLPYEGRIRKDILLWTFSRGKFTVALMFGQKRGFRWFFDPTPVRPYSTLEERRKLGLKKTPRQQDEKAIEELALDAALLLWWKGNDL